MRITHIQTDGRGDMQVTFEGAEREFAVLNDSTPPRHFDPAWWSCARIAEACGAARRPVAERAVFNGPATVLFWDDGEKTVVKCSECERACGAGGKAPGECLNRRYDREKAVMAAMLKRLHPNYQDELRAVLGVER